MKTDNVSADEKAVINLDENEIPDVVPILPSNEQVVFPTLNLSLTISEKLSEFIEVEMKGNA